jgi:hypothetical protein
VLIGADAEMVAARIAELTAIIKARYQALREQGRGVRFGPDVVVVFDGSRRLRSLPGAVAILREGPGVGVFSICLDAASIAARWQASSRGESTRAVIGACYDGPFGIDLARDGPHALVAGTTGASPSGCRR